MAVTTTVETAVEPASGLGQAVSMAWNFMTSPWMFFLLALAVLVAVFIYFRKQTEKLERLRSDIKYQEYDDATRDAYLNRQTAWIRKRRRILMPWTYEDMSLRVVNYQGDLIGYYRGHSYCSDGSMYVTAYKDKKWIIFEEPFLIKIPNVYEWTEHVTDEKTKESTTVTRRINWKDERAYEWLPSEQHPSTLRINCTGLELYQSYFRIPILVDAKGKVLGDLRGMYGAMFSKSHSDRLLHLSMQESRDAVREAFRHNPALGFVQRTPIEEREEDAS